MKSLEFEVLCPICGGRIIARGDAKASCDKCGKEYPVINNNIVSLLSKEDAFYESMYEDRYAEWVKEKQRTRFSRIAAAIIDNLSLSRKGERFLRRHLEKGENLIMDLGCGPGQTYLTNYGRVIGLDTVLAPLIKASKFYDLCVHADAFAIPFPDDYFDYIISLNFIGHVPNTQKDILFEEMHRILKPGARMIHIIETDSANRWFKFAHKYPELFQRYFVEALGHFGLEISGELIRRLENRSFKLIKQKKIWGAIWGIDWYKEVFDNEYKQKSKSISGLVFLSKMLSTNGIVREISNIILNPLSVIGEAFTHLDNVCLLAVFVEKLPQERANDGTS